MADAVLHCPRCRTEYRPGFTECADCEELLVFGVPQAQEVVDHRIPDFSNFVAIFDTGDGFGLSAAASSLADAGIAFVIDNDPPDVAREVRVAEHSWGELPQRLKVSPDRVDEARALLETFSHPDFAEYEPDDTPE